MNTVMRREQDIQSVDEESRGGNIGSGAPLFDK